MPRRSTPQQIFNASLTSDPNEQQTQEHWNKVSRQLVNWGRSPATVDEDEFESPSENAIRLADQLADELRCYGCHLPFGIVSDGEGGIVFERRDADSTELFKIRADGAIEYIELRDSRVVERYPIELA